MSYTLPGGKVNKIAYCHLLVIVSHTIPRGKGKQALLTVHWLILVHAITRLRFDRRRSRTTYIKTQLYINFVRNAIDINEHETLSTITRRHKFKLINSTCIAVLYFTMTIRNIYNFILNSIQARFLDN